MSAAEIIVNNIGKLLESARLSQGELARRTGISQPQISAYLSGKNVPGIEQLERIAAALDTTISELAGPGDPRSAPTSAERLRLEGIALLLRLDGDELVLALERLRKLSRPLRGAGAQKNKPSAG